MALRNVDLDFPVPVHTNRNFEEGSMGREIMESLQNAVNDKKRKINRFLAKGQKAMRDYAFVRERIDDVKMKMDKCAEDREKKARRFSEIMRELEDLDLLFEQLVEKEAEYKGKVVEWIENCDSILENI